MKRYLKIFFFGLITLSLLAGCGLKGPLYEKPPEQEKSQPKKD